MSKIIKSSWYEYLDKLWYVNAKKSGLRTDILRGLLCLLDMMLLKHRKVFIFRFDLSVNDYTESNELMTVLVRRLGKRVKSHYKTQFTYCWVREHEKAKRQHYHFCLMLDGSKVNNPFMLQEWLATIWEQYGRCHWAGYHSFERNDYRAIQEATFHISYLAKPRGKGYRPAQTKDFGRSRNTSI